MVGSLGVLLVLVLVILIREGCGPAKGVVRGGRWWRLSGVWDAGSV